MFKTFTGSLVVSTVPSHFLTIVQDAVIYDK
jgi:hypothetical protein